MASDRMAQALQGLFPSRAEWCTWHRSHIVANSLDAPDTAEERLSIEYLPRAAEPTDYLAHLDPESDESCEGGLALAPTFSIRFAGSSEYFIQWGSISADNGTFHVLEHEYSSVESALLRI